MAKQNLRRYKFAGDEISTISNRGPAIWQEDKLRGEKCITEAECLFV